ncbi:uncharacterized protein LOC117173553 [Belonocnema kinseyi]|uniref:uncharacterized protein LOC117173553 n=1 Tax=Belonocnema kinseyi TaxID=2817044 RepID=UPI00143DC4CB|nr:uncharacterized protein LOC117173553 [Belonocnema kinseyi]
MALSIMERKGTKPSSLMDVVEFMRENRWCVGLVPEYLRFIKLLMTIPGSSCSNERSFSVLRHEIKVMLQALDLKLEGFERSIQYDLYKKFQEIKEEVRAVHRPDLTLALQRRSILPAFPKTDLQDFKDFDQQLLNPEMFEAFKPFILLHSDRLTDMNSAFNVIIPMIIDKNVQMQYTGFERPKNNVAKENFSTTHSFLIFEEIILQKCPNTVSVKDINRKLSRGLSQAPDRKERLNKIAKAGSSGSNREAVTDP